jgi:hypothetical protein
MTIFTSPRRRELAHRIADGIEVTLFWDQAADALGLEVRDWRTGEMLALDVEPHSALEAFNHPFPYAARQARRARGKQGTWRDDRPLP